MHVRFPLAWLLGSEQCWGLDDVVAVIFEAAEGGKSGCTAREEFPLLALRPIAKCKRGK